MKLVVVHVGAPGGVERQDAPPIPANKQNLLPGALWHANRFCRTRHSSLKCSIKINFKVGKYTQLFPIYQFPILNYNTNQRKVSTIFYGHIYQINFLEFKMM